MTRRATTALLTGAMISVVLTATSAFADTGPCDAPQGPAQYPANFDWNAELSSGRYRRIRKKAQDAGITLCLQYNATVYDNVKGGLKRGPIGEGQIYPWIDIDLGKLTHLDLLDDTFVHASLYSMQGRPITTREIGSFAVDHLLRGACDDAAWHRVDRAALPRRQAELASGPARRRRRVHHLPHGHRLHQQHIRISELDGDNSPGRRPGLPAAGTGRAPEIQPHGRHDLDGRCLYGRSGGEEQSQPAAREPLWHHVQPEWRHALHRGSRLLDGLSQFGRRAYRHL